jgi:predicted CXXCH cytochrome family protein
MRTILWSVLLYAAFIAVAPVSYAVELKIVTPRDKALVSSKQIVLVLELPEQGIDEVRVEVNRQPKIARKGIYGERFLCWGDLPLEYGINQIRILAIRSDRVVDEKQLSVFGRALGPGTIEVAYRREDFHKPKTEQVCAGCHVMETDPPDQATCFACHGVVNAGSYVHEPTVTSCLTCHNPQTPLGTRTQRDLCGRCHMLSLEAWSGKRYEHGPLALGLCTACHDPHASGQPGMLRQEPTALCLSCHDEIGTRPHLLTTFSGGGHPLSSLSNPLRPDEPFSCHSCHNPHAGDSPVFIDHYADGNRMRFCVSCHAWR